MKSKKILSLHPPQKNAPLKLTFNQARDRAAGGWLGARDAAKGTACEDQKLGNKTIK